MEEQDLSNVAEAVLAKLLRACQADDDSLPIKAWTLVHEAILLLSFDCKGTYLFPTQVEELKDIKEVYEGQHLDLIKANYHNLTKG